MKKIVLTILTFAILFSVKAQQIVAICKEKQGCQIANINLSRIEIDRLLEKRNFLTAAPKNAILVLNDCKSEIEVKKTNIQLHQSFGGKASPKNLTTFDLRKYLLEKGCLAICPNTTKKLSFYASASGEGAHTGNGYFFLNLKAGEAYMPNAAFQQFYGSEAKGMILDQFIRNGAMESYTIAEGQKYHTKMPIGTNISVIKNDALNEKRFKTDFKKTGKSRKHLNTNQTETEYTGKDDDGKPMSFWITPVVNVCLPKGKFDAFGFYNLGYISVDGITYLVTEISGSGFQIKLTGIAEGSYSFNPAGYKSY